MLLRLGDQEVAATRFGATQITSCICRPPVQINAPALLPGHAAALLLLLTSASHALPRTPSQPQIPRSCQCMLMSATSSEDVDRLTKLVLHNPLTLNLLGAATSGEQVWIKLLTSPCTDAHMCWRVGCCFASRLPQLSSQSNSRL